MPALAVPMERASSAGSTTSTEGRAGPSAGVRPLASKKASLDLDKPRKHGRRRTSLPVHASGSLDSAAAERRRFKDAILASAASSASNSQGLAEGSTSASRRLGARERSSHSSVGTGGSSGRRRRSMPASAREAGRRPAHRSTILRHIPQGAPGGSAVEEADSEDDGSVQTLSPRAQSPDFDSSYAAGPSGSAKGESDIAGVPALSWMSPESASELETTDAETFGWDKVRRRRSGGSAIAAAVTATAGQSTGLGLAAGGSSQGDLSPPPVEEPGLLGRTRTPRPGAADKEGLFPGSIKRSNSYSGRGGSREEGSSEGMRNSGSGRTKGASSGVGGLLSPPANTDLAQPSTPSLSSKKGAVIARGKKRARGALITSAAEGALLLGAGVWACVQMAGSESEIVRSRTLELAWSVGLSALYMFFKGSGEGGMIWATDRGTYRLAGDDGILVGLLAGPLIAFAGLTFSLQGPPVGKAPSPSGDPLPYPLWRVEGPPLHVTGGGSPKGGKVGAGVSALTLSQCSLLSLQSLNTTILLLHLVATRWYRRPHQLPVSRWRRFGSFVVFQLVATMVVETVREAAGYFQAPLFTGLRRWELITSVVIFQMCLHTTSRLARKSFTLGELTLVGALAASLAMEATHITLAKLLPASTPFVNTTRHPTPLLIFQLALIVGMLFLGFFLSPLLYLSRHLAQKPLHRLRWPDKRDLHRRLLAGFFYFFAVVFVVGVLGTWVRWLLGWRDPWLWTLRFLTKGRYWWSRPALIAYWLVLITASVASWQAVVINAKRYRMRVVVAKPNQDAPTGMEVSDMNAASGAVGGASSAHGGSGVAKKRGGIAVARGLNGLAAGVAGAASSTETGGLTMKKAAHLSLNARRKFFHALAVLLFVPGIAIDPAFTHLAFSLAFSAFILAEYVRYYALYPFGAALHVFLSEFTDAKDSGPVILSHFYLLAGCAAPVWLEAPSRLLLQMGVLILGVGDALASIVGRRYGRIHWPASSKTVEGSAAFFASVWLSAWLLRLAGWAGDFSFARFSAVLCILSILEGCTEQNDNLILPIYSVIAFSLFHV